jgi:hypothetical protein
MCSFQCSCAILLITNTSISFPKYKVAMDTVLCSLSKTAISYVDPEMSSHYSALSISTYV